MADINYQLLYAIAQVVRRRRLCIAALLLNRKRRNKKRRWVSNFLCKRKTHGAYYTTTNYTMRPFPGKGGLTKEKRIFNYRLSRARRMVECAFGILSSQWRIYKRPINTSIQTAENIIKSTIVLHNFLRQNADDINCSPENINIMDISTLPETETAAFKDLSNVGSNTHTREASHIRSIFVEYFNNEGAVPWQEMFL